MSVPASVPYSQRYFEDYSVGEVAEFGSALITEGDILEFARRYDPQPFHIDPQAARGSNFGGLIASGWMTAAVVMRMLVDQFISPISTMGSPGMDELRWLTPVRPGDRLRVRVTVLQMRRSESKPDRGLIQLHHEAVNQHGETVYQAKGWGIYRCRPVAA